MVDKFPAHAESPQGSPDFFLPVKSCGYEVYVPHLLSVLLKADYHSARCNAAAAGDIQVVESVRDILHLFCNSSE